MKYFYCQSYQAFNLALALSMEDKVTIITGAANGIGFACAKRFADDGAVVIIADIDLDEDMAAPDAGAAPEMDLGGLEDLAGSALGDEEPGAADLVPGARDDEGRLRQ